MGLFEFQIVKNIRISTRIYLLTAMALIPLPAIVLLRDLGPAPGRRLEETIWK